MATQTEVYYVHILTQAEVSEAEYRKLSAWGRTFLRKRERHKPTIQSTFIYPDGQVSHDKLDVGVLHRPYGNYPSLHTIRQHEEDERRRRAQDDDDRRRRNDDFNASLGISDSSFSSWGVLGSSNDSNSSSSSSDDSYSGGGGDFGGGGAGDDY